MRLFFALWPDADVTRELADAASSLKLESGRRVEPTNYHLTLAFVGEVDALKLAPLRQIGQSLRASQFTIGCDSLVFWPKSQVVVAAACAPPALQKLSRSLRDAIGLPRERLRAHVTLARKVTQAPVLQAMSPIVWRPTHFSLIRSDTGGVESAYTVLDTWPLLYETENP